MRRLVSLICAVLAVACDAVGPKASTVDGEWIGLLATPAGIYQMTLQLEEARSVHGSALLTWPAGHRAYAVDGTRAGATVGLYLTEREFRHHVGGRFMTDSILASINTLGFAAIPITFMRRVGGD